MKTVKAIVERAESNYSAYLEGIDGVIASGKDLDEIKKNMIDAVEFFIEGCKECGCEVPEELQGEYELIFEMDIKTVLTYYNGILSKSGLEKVTGINQKQLWHYATGAQVPRAKQKARIEAGLHKLGKELALIHL